MMKFKKQIIKASLLLCALATCLIGNNSVSADPIKENMNDEISKIINTQGWHVDTRYADEKRYYVDTRGDLVRSGGNEPIIVKIDNEFYSFDKFGFVIGIPYAVKIKKYVDVETKKTVEMKTSNMYIFTKHGANFVM